MLTNFFSISEIKIALAVHIKLNIKKGVIEACIRIYMPDFERCIFSFLSHKVPKYFLKILRKDINTFPQVLLVSFTDQ